MTTFAEAIAGRFARQRQEAEDAVKAADEARQARVRRLQVLKAEDRGLFDMLPGEVRAMVPAGEGDAA
jgi:hypothetical protein